MTATAATRVETPAPPGPAPRAGDPRALLAVAVSGAGLLVQTIGYALGWAGRPYAIAYFYTGLVLIVAPCAWVLIGRSASRAQRLGVGLSLALLLYLSYFLTSPLLATRFDETLHVATLRSVLGGDGVFAANSMLPVSPYYPALELITAAVRWLTGWPVTACEAVVVVVARAGLVLALYLLVERFTRSARAAGVAVLLYCASSQFYFFNAQFAYQTIAITFTLGLIYFVQRAIDAPARWPRGPLAGALAMIIGVTLSHHLTSWLTVAVLWAWALLHRLGEHRLGEHRLGGDRVGGHRRATRIVSAAAVASTVAVGGWTAVVGSRISTYLLPLFSDAQHQLGGVLSGSTNSKKLFVDTSGAQTPPWERVAMFGSMLIWVALVVVAGWSALRGRTLGRSRLVLLPVGVAALYPLLLLARVSPVATNVADRASTFVFFALVLVVAVWAVPHLDRVNRVATVAVTVVLMLGGVILGSGPDWERVPGPYLVGAEQRSVDASSLAAARWAGAHMPAGSAFASDVTLSALIPDYADASPVLAIGGRQNVSDLFFTPNVDGRDLALIRDNGIAFVVVDTRLSMSLPHAGTYFEPNVDNPAGTPARVTAQSLTKFETAPGFVKVLDGPVRIYDVRTILGQPRTYADRASSPVPGSTVGWQLILSTLVVGVALLVLVARRRRPTRPTRPLQLLLGALAIAVVAAAIVVAIVSAHSALFPADHGGEIAVTR